jgi:hypothetical protein
MLPPLASAAASADKPRRMVCVQTNMGIMPQFFFPEKAGTDYATPAEKLTRIEIAVAGLDCKACSFVAYQSVAKIDGVRQVRDEITVLPVSQFDDRLRYRIARAIYGNPNFWNYAIMADPPVHIVVEHSRVTLTGVVQSDVERMLARSIAGSQFGVMSVVNNLKTDAEAREALEKAF